MIINIQDGALEYIKDNGSILTIETKVAGGWVKVEEPVMFLERPKQVEVYNQHSQRGIDIYIRKSVKAEDIRIKLKKILFIKYLVVDGIKTNTFK